MTEYAWTLFGQQTGSALTSDSGTDTTFGMQFSISQTAHVTGIWWYSPDSATNLPTECGIFLCSTELIVLASDSPDWSGDAGSGWVKCTFDGSFTLQAGYNYVVAVWSPTNADLYGATSGFWTTGGNGANGLTNGIVSAPNNSSSLHGQGPYNSGGSGLTYPTSVSGEANYWVDIEVTTGWPSATAPVSGFTLQSPRSWNSGDLVTTPRLRADMYNLAALATQARPLILSTLSQEIPFNEVSILSQNSPQLNNWNIIPTQGPTLAAGPGTATFYAVPLPGWYLAQGWIGLAPLSGGGVTTQYTAGIAYTQGTALTVNRTDFAQASGPPAGTFPSSSAYIGQSSAELLLMTPVTGDAIGVYAYTTASAGANADADWALDWVGLPSSSTINGVAYTGPVGTVVASPKPATLWPSGPGATLSGSVSAGGTVLTMPATPGLRAGQVIGLDWIAGQQYQPYAETATVAAVTGGTVTVTGGLSYGHSAGAPVAVPVSAALLNEQIRDQSNFWFYPPMLRAVQGTASAQAITTATWTTIHLALTGSGITNTIDNFSGWATVTANSYTIPVSGVYFIAGQVYFVGSTALTTWGARLIDNNGVTYSGDEYASEATGNAVFEAPAVRRHLRLTAGQTIALQGFQSSGSTVDTNPTQETDVGFYTFLPRLIVVFRSF